MIDNFRKLNIRFLYRRGGDFTSDYTGSMQVDLKDTDELFKKVRSSDLNDELYSEYEKLEEKYEKIGEDMGNLIKNMMEAELLNYKNELKEIFRKHVDN